MSFGNVELTSAREGDDRNASEMLVARGFATVVRHRSDEERSSVYEVLVDLEEKAKQVRHGTCTLCSALSLCVCVCV
jgi:staphylococcal nuclease domain-containing protein 1